MRHHLAVAQRPVAAAARTRTRRPNEGAPENDEQVEAEHHPGEAREARSVGAHHPVRSCTRLASKSAMWVDSTASKASPMERPWPNDSSNWRKCTAPPES